MSITISRCHISPATAAIGRHTARNELEPPPTAMAPRPMAMETMAAHTKFLTPVMGLRCTE